MASRRVRSTVPRAAYSATWLRIMRPSHPPVAATGDRVVARSRRSKTGTRQHAFRHAAHAWPGTSAGHRASSHRTSHALLVILLVNDADGRASLSDKRGRFFGREPLRNGRGAHLIRQQSWQSHVRERVATHVVPPHLERRRRRADYSDVRRSRFRTLLRTVRRLCVLVGNRAERAEGLVHGASRRDGVMRRRHAPVRGRSSGAKPSPAVGPPGIESGYAVQSRTWVARAAEELGSGRLDGSLTRRGLLLHRDGNSGSRPPLATQKKELPQRAGLSSSSKRPFRARAGPQPCPTRLARGLGHRRGGGLARRHLAAADRQCCARLSLHAAHPAGCPSWVRDESVA